MVVLQFKKEDHEENMNLLHRIKKDVCTLYEKLEESEKEAMGNRHYEIDSFDERRGSGMNYRGGMNRRDDMGERRGGSRGGRMGRRDEEPYRPMYPEYPFDERGGGRYDY